MYESKKRHCPEEGEHRHTVLETGIHTGHPSRQVMEKQLVAKLLINFEDSAYEENGVEYWLARDLQILFGFYAMEKF